jgi:dTDP-4-amino-4,6-dideoxygalactose transaminase
VTGDGRDRFRSLIGEHLEVAPERVTLFGRGRVAFYAILRALDIGPGDEVIVPSFTCVAVPNAILYTGARPVWVDIDPATYTIDPVAAEAAVSPQTRVILAQNTYGLSADLDALAAIANRHGLTVIDDCTHGLGGLYRGQPNGATAPLSFFSTQWSKPVSTGLGGFAVDREGAAAARLRESEASALEPSAVRVAALRVLLYGREHAGAGRMFRVGRATYRWFGRHGIVPGSSTQDELDGVVMPARFLTGLSESQARLGSDRLSRLGGEVARRRNIAHAYSDWLIGNGRAAPVEPADQEHAFLRYPLRVTDRTRFMSEAEQAGIDLGDWFVSPVHPVLDRLDRWGYLAGTAPNAELACREIVNLPTDRTVGDNDVEQVIAFLGRHIDLIQ